MSQKRIIVVSWGFGSCEFGSCNMDSKMGPLENGGKLRATMTESGEYFGINCGKTGQTAEKL